MSRVIQIGVFVIILAFGLVSCGNSPFMDRRLDAVYKLTGPDQKTYLLIGFHRPGTRSHGVNCFISLRPSDGEEIGEVCVSAGFSSKDLNLVKLIGDRIYFQNREGITLCKAPDLEELFDSESFEEELERVNPEIHGVHTLKAISDHIEVVTNTGERFFVAYSDLQAYRDLNELQADSTPVERPEFTLESSGEINKRFVHAVSGIDLRTGYIRNRTFASAIAKGYETIRSHADNEKIEYIDYIILENGDVLGLNGKVKSQLLQLLPDGIFNVLTPQLNLLAADFVQVDPGSTRTPALLENPDSFLISHYSTLARENREHLVSRIGLDGKALFSISLNDYAIASDNEIASAMIVDGALLLLFKNARVVALNPNSGALLWKQ